MPTTYVVSSGECVERWEAPSQFLLYFATTTMSITRAWKRLPAAPAAVPGETSAVQIRKPCLVS
jgi:hypothetical protein